MSGFNRLMNDLKSEGFVWKPSVTILLSFITLFTLIALPYYMYSHWGNVGTVLGVSTAGWIYYIITHLWGGLSITVYAHRLVSHNAVKEVKPWVHAFFLLGNFFALQNSIYLWTGNHVTHHTPKYEDQPEDPYSVERGGESTLLGFLWAHCMWICFEPPKAYQEIYDNAIPDRVRNNKLIMLQHKYYAPIALLLLVVFPLGLGYALNGLTGAAEFFILNVFRLFVIQHVTWCVNSVAHLTGHHAQRHPSARNNKLLYFLLIPPYTLIILLAMGELGRHGDHHDYPTSYWNGFSYFDYDPSRWVIFTLWLLGGVSGLKSPNKQTREEYAAKRRIEWLKGRIPPQEWIAAKAELDAKLKDFTSSLKTMAQEKRLTLPKLPNKWARERRMNELKLSCWNARKQLDMTIKNYKIHAKEWAKT